MHVANALLAASCRVYAPKAPDTRSRNWHHGPKFDARFWRQFFVLMHNLLMSLTAFGP